MSRPCGRQRVGAGEHGEGVLLADAVEGGDGDAGHAGHSSILARPAGRIHSDAALLSRTAQPSYLIRRRVAIAVDFAAPRAYLAGETGRTTMSVRRGAWRPGKAPVAVWFDNPDDPDMTALYIERYMNWGLTREELQSGKPIIGIAQSGSDLSPCNRHHLDARPARPRGHPRGGRRRLRVPGASDPGDRQAADRLARPQPRLSRPGRDALRLSARRRRADHRLRQDHARRS